MAMINVDGVDVEQTEAQIADQETLRTAMKTFLQKRSMIQELTALDLIIPPALEDQWKVTNFDTTLLPQDQQDNLARKQYLRTQIANI